METGESSVPRGIPEERVMLRLRSYASRILPSLFDAKARASNANVTKGVSEIARFLEQTRILKGFGKPIRLQRELARRCTIRRTLFRPLPSTLSSFQLYFYYRTSRYTAFAFLM